MVGQDGNVDWMIYNKYNKNLKERFKFINKIMDWNTFADDLIGQKNKFMSGNDNSPWKNLTNEVLQDEAMAKEHFSVSKSGLMDIME